MPGQRFTGQPTFSTPEAAPQDEQLQASQPPMPITPQRYRSNATVIGAIGGVIALIIVVLLVVWGIRPQNHTSPSPTESTPVLPTGFTPSPNWQGIEFTADDYGASGYWQVSQPSWNGDYVSITTTLTVETGTMRFTFFALDNQQSAALYETSGGTMETGSVPHGQSKTGTVELYIPREDFTLYLATARGTQVAALLISA